MMCRTPSPMRSRWPLCVDDLIAARRTWSAISCWMSFSQQALRWAQKSAIDIPPPWPAPYHDFAVAVFADDIGVDPARVDPELLPDQGAQTAVSSTSPSRSRRVAGKAENFHVA